jgi:TrmH family RNA methyltransferase
VDRLKNPRFRRREGHFLVEGTRAVQEFLEGPIHRHLRFALISPRLEGFEGGRRLKMRLEGAGPRVEEISDQELSAVSDTENPQGVVLVIKEEEQSLPPSEKAASERVLLLDGVQDPGNAGTLIRAGRAFGLSRAIALEGTVDLFSPKVVRASAGALAHLPAHRLAWSETAAWLKESEIPLLVGGAGGRDVRTFPVPLGWALVIGNEGAGARLQVQDTAREVLGIPMSPGNDSLNAGVAGAILMFALNPPPGIQWKN